MPLTDDDKFEWNKQNSLRYFHTANTCENINMTIHIVINTRTYLAERQE